MRTIGSAHEADITAALTSAEHEELARLLDKVAAGHGLAPNVHPGYKAPAAPSRSGTHGAGGADAGAT